MADLRKNSYTYHRLALDTFEKTPDQSRDKIVEVLRNIKRIWAIYPNSILLISFFDTKSNELTQILSEGNLNSRREAYDILSAIDPKRTIYQSIISK